MKSKILFIFIFIAFSLNGIAQIAETKTIIKKSSKGIVRSIIFSNNDKSVPIPESADIFFKNVLNFQTADRFERIPINSIREGYTHERFEQYYNGVIVDGAGYVFHYHNGVMYFANGNYVRIFDLNTNPSISAEDAKSVFVGYKNISVDSIVSYNTALMIKEIPLDNDTLPMLVYKVRLIADHPDNDEFGFVDAQIGKVVYTEPAFINVLGTFATRYSVSQKSHTRLLGGNYILEDITRGATIHTYNLQNNTTVLSSRVELFDNDNNWTTAEHGSNNNDMALDVHWGLQQIYDRLYNAHNINSYDDNGLRIDAYVQYGKDLDNAHWLGGPSELAVVFGIGKTDFKPLASIDVVAHEFGHGITQHQIDWSSNQFNEGMSDIWGAIMKYRITPNQPTWLIGNQIMKSSSYSCLRNLQTTNSSSAYTIMANTFGSTTYNNSSDIYVRSGVFSHWFYLLVNGGSGTNGIGNNYQVHGIGMDLSEKLIVEAVFRNKLRFTTSFADLRDAFVLAANVLDGGSGSPVAGFITQQVVNAWYAVGVGTNPTQISFIFNKPNPALLCSASSQTFSLSSITNAPSGAVYTWESSSNVTLTGTTGTSTSAKAKNNFVSGDGWVSIKINGVTLATASVWVGAPQATTGIGIWRSNSPAVYTFAVDQNLSGYPSSVTWDLYPSSSAILPDIQFTTFYYSGTYSFSSYSYNQTYWVAAITTNACGSGLTPIISPSSTHFTVTTGTAEPEIQWSPPPPPYPNPASDVLSIETGASAKSQNSNLLFDVRLYDGQGNLLQQKSNKGGTLQFNVSGLPNGIYFIHIYDGVSSTPEMHQIIVEH